MDVRREVKFDAGPTFEPLHCRPWTAPRPLCRHHNIRLTSRGSIRYPRNGDSPETGALRRMLNSLRVLPNVQTGSLSLSLDPYKSQIMPPTYAGPDGYPTCARFMAVCGTWSGRAASQAISLLFAGCADEQLSIERVRWKNRQWPFQVCFLSRLFFQTYPSMVTGNFCF